MATFTTKPNGSILVRVRIKGVATSKSFKLKRDARAWATKLEAEIEAGATGSIPDKTFGDLITKFIEGHVQTLDGVKQESLRLKRALKDPIASVKLQDLSVSHVAEWRDRRLKSVSAESVRREWSSLGHACQLAKQEWRWLRVNPFREVKQPAKSQPRRRRITQEEVDALLLACNYEKDVKPTTMQAAVGAIMLFAIETAMRAGEICALKWSEIDLDARVSHVTATVRGARKTKRSREVPLSAEAIRILKQFEGGDSVFEMLPATLDALFRKAKSRAMITGLHFHDTRAEALTRLSKKLNPMQLAKVSGHQDLRILYSVYYREDIGEIVKVMEDA